MAGIEDLLRQRREALERIDAQTAGDIAGRQMIQTHNDLLFPLIETHGGRIIKTIGDSIGEAEFLGLIFAGLRRQLGEASELEVGEDYDGLRALAEGIAAAGLRLVLLADEFESVTKNQHLGAELYSFLRSLANNYPVGFVTASARNLKDMCVSHQIADSPFFNIFAVSHVGLFREEEALALIREPSAACAAPRAS